MACHTFPLLSLEKTFAPPSGIHRDPLVSSSQAPGFLRGHPWGAWQHCHKIYHYWNPCNSCSLNDLWLSMAIYEMWPASWRFCSVDGRRSSVLTVERDMEDRDFASLIRSDISLQVSTVVTRQRRTWSKLTGVGCLDLLTWSSGKVTLHNLQWTTGKISKIFLSAGGSR